MSEQFSPEIRKQVKREIDKLVGRESSKLILLFSDLIGKPIPKNVFADEKLRTSVSKEINSYFEDTWHTFSPDYSTLPASEQVRRIRAFIGRQLRRGERIPRGIDPLTWYVEALDMVVGPGSAKSWAKRSSSQYLEATGWLVNQLVDRGKVEAARAFLVMWKDSPEAFALGQTWIQRIPAALNYLDRIRRKRLEKHHVRKLLDLYLMLSGVFEILLVLLIVMVRISNGQNIQYERLSKMRLADRIRLVNQVPELAILTRTFRTGVRNSIAHASFRILYSRRRILFGAAVELSWDQFRKETVDLSLLVLAISFSPLIYVHNQLRLLDRFLDPTNIPNSSAQM